MIKQIQYITSLEALYKDNCAKAPGIYYCVEKSEGYICNTCVINTLYSKCTNNTLNHHHLFHIRKHKTVTTFAGLPVVVTLVLTPQQSHTTVHSAFQHNTTHSGNSSTSITAQWTSSTAPQSESKL